MPKNYQWKYSYEAYAFDTIDGNLHEGEYAVSDLGGYLIYDSSYPQGIQRVKKLNITGMTEIHRIENRAFDVFKNLDTGLLEKFPCDLQIYRSLAVKDSGQRTKIDE